MAVAVTEVVVERLTVLAGIPPVTVAAEPTLDQLRFTVVVVAVAAAYMPVTVVAVASLTSVRYVD